MQIMNATKFTMCPTVNLQCYIFNSSQMFCKMFTELTPGVASWTVNAEWVKVKHCMKDCADTPAINRNKTTENNLPLKLTTNTHSIQKKIMVILQINIHQQCKTYI